MYFYFHGSFFFSFFLSVVGCGTLHFYSGFSVNALAGVEILVRLLWPSSAWQAKPRPTSSNVWKALAVLRA